MLPKFKKGIVNFPLLIILFFFFLGTLYFFAAAGDDDDEENRPLNAEALTPLGGEGCTFAFINPIITDKKYFVQVNGPDGTYRVALRPAESSDTGVVGIFGNRGSDIGEMESPDAHGQYKITVYKSSKGRHGDSSYGYCRSLTGDTLTVLMNPTKAAREPENVPNYKIEDYPTYIIHGSNSEIGPCYPFGDISYDGEVNKIDTRQMPNVINAYNQHGVYNRRADLTDDGKITSEDAALLNTFTTHSDGDGHRNENVWPVCNSKNEVPTDLNFVPPTDTPSITIPGTPIDPDPDAPTNPATGQGPCYPYGDVNGDGKVNEFDAADILNFEAGIDVANFDKSRSDLNKDDNTNSEDAAILLQYLEGILSDFPVCPAGSSTSVSANPDIDGDGFNNTTEQYLGTDPNAACPNDKNHSAWPPDFNNDGVVNMFNDIFAVAVKYNSTEARYDLSEDGKVDFTDINIVRSYFGQRCS